MALFGLFGKKKNVQDDAKENATRLQQERYESDMDLVLQLLQEKKYNEAVDVVEKYASEGKIQAVFYLAFAKEHLGKHEVALKYAKLVQDSNADEELKQQAGKLIHNIQLKIEEGIIYQAVDDYNEGKYIEVIHACKEYAEKGSIPARYILALALNQNNDTEEALKWAKNVVGSLDGDWKANIEHLIENHEASKRKEEQNTKRKALEDMKQATEAGKLAGKEGRIEEAIQLFQKPAEGEYFPAMYYLALSFGKIGKYNEALVWTERLLDKCQDEKMREQTCKLDEQLRLSQHKTNLKLYEKASSLIEAGDIEGAFLHIKRASENGMKEAQFALGIMYQNGEGTEIDHSLAIKWLKSAAENGNIEAKRELMAIYWEGTGVEKDVDEAYKWCKSAAEQGDEHSQEILPELEVVVKRKQLYDSILEEEKQGNYTKTLAYAKQLYQLEEENQKVDIELAYMIGMTYYEGTGVEKDLKEAMHWLQIAGEGDKKDARRAVVLTYLSNECEKSEFDEEKVKRWMPEVFGGLLKTYRCDISKLRKQIQDVKESIKQGKYLDFFGKAEFTSDFCLLAHVTVSNGKFSQELYFPYLLLTAQLPLNSSDEVNAGMTSIFAGTLEGFKNKKQDEITMDIIFMLDALKRIGILERDDSDKTGTYRIAPEIRESFLQVRDMWASYEKSITGKSKTKSEEYMEFQEAIKNYRKS